MSTQIFQASTDGSGLRIGVVQSRFNDSVCDALRAACLAELLSLGVEADDIIVCTVPGALEIPFALQRMADSLDLDALIALGAVIRGETYHFEVVSNESARGVQTVALESGIPVANAVLTTNTDEQAQARAAEKGAEAARVAVEMANLSNLFGELQGDDLNDPVFEQ
jgi:6,7-dimethyl-8-ribityllumazine synthase